jgi:hypothetical protein
MNGTLPNGTLTNGDLKNGTVANGHAQNGSVGNGHLLNGAVSNGGHCRMNGEVSAASEVDGITIARKALFHIGEGLQEKVTALVNSATMAAKSATNDNVRNF